MHIKLPNGILIEDASEELVRAVLAAPSLALLGALSTKPAEHKKAAPDTVAESSAPEVITPESKGKKMHPLNKCRRPADGYDPLPPIVSTITGSHRIAKTEMFLILSELNRAGRDLRPKEIHDRLVRFEVFSELKMSAVYHGLAMLVKYGAVVHEERTYRIAPEIDGSFENDLIALIDLHDTPAEWADNKH